MADVYQSYSDDKYEMAQQDLEAENQTYTLENFSQNSVTHNYWFFELLIITSYD